MEHSENIKLAQKLKAKWKTDTNSVSEAFNNWINIIHGETHFKDLSPYKYLYPKPNTYCIGWLRNDKIFQTGHTDLYVIDIIKKSKLRNICKGHHNCNLCINQENPATGNGEYWIQGKTGKKYVMPELVIHYIERHNYMIPLEVQMDILKTIS